MWNTKINSYFRKINFKWCASDQSVCVFRDERNIQVFLALYVDDLFILNKSINSINNVKFFSE